MNTWIKSTSTGKLILVGLMSVVLLAFGAAIAQGGAAKAPRTTLVKLADNAAKAPAPLGISARVEWTNNMLGDLPVNNPLLTSGAGRMWADSKGNLRVEMQGGNSDSQLMIHGNQIKIWDAQGNTLYSWSMKSPRSKKAYAGSRSNKKAAKKDWLVELGQYWNISQPEPTTQANRSAYRINLTPKQPMGLLGGMSLVVDGQYKLPLAFSLAAKDVADPIISLQATEADFSAVDGSVFDWKVPDNAKVVNFNTKSLPRRAKNNKVASKLVAPALPATLLGLDRTQTVNQKGMIVTTYGQDLNGIVVIQSAASKTNQMIARLPKVQVSDQSLPSLQTPLGGMIQSSKNGINTTVIGSQTQARLIQAMQELI